MRVRNASTAFAARRAEKTDARKKDGPPDARVRCRRSDTSSSTQTLKNGFANRLYSSKCSLRFQRSRSTYRPGDEGCLSGCVPATLARDGADEASAVHLVRHSAMNRQPVDDDRRPGGVAGRPERALSGRAGGEAEPRSPLVAFPARQPCGARGISFETQRVTVGFEVGEFRATQLDGATEDRGPELGGIVRGPRRERIERHRPDPGARPDRARIESNSGDAVTRYQLTLR